MSGALPLPALTLAGALAALLTLLCRAALLALAPALHEDSAHRLTSSTASIGVLLSVSLLGALGNAFGCATLLGHMAADLACSALLGPATTPLMLAHHAVTMFLTGMGLVVMQGDEPALRGMVAHVASALLWMEGTNPFLHACQVVAAEASLAHVRWLVLPVCAPGLVLAFLYLRVLALPGLLPLIWSFRAQLAPLGEVYVAVVAALAALQLWWFYKILSKIWRDVHKAQQPVKPS
jgi:hypothetical protein